MEGEIRAKGQLIDFFVMIPDSVSLKFRVSKKLSVLEVQELLDFLLMPSGNLFRVPPFKDTLFYQDTPLKPDVNVLTFGHNKAFLLEQRNYQSEHSGLLWTCKNHKEGRLLAGRTRLEKFNTHHKNCEIMFSDLLLSATSEGSKKLWGLNRDKNKRPYGCPRDQQAAEVSQPQVISDNPNPNQTLEEVEEVKTRSNCPIKVLHQLASESETDSEIESDLVRSKPLPRIRNLDPSNETVKNMTVIRQEMEDHLNGPQPGNGRFVPTEADIAWEKVNIIAPTALTKIRSLL